MCSAPASTNMREHKARGAEGRHLPLPSLSHCPVLLPGKRSGHITDFCPRLREAFFVVKWRNSLTDCSRCLILRIRTNNRLNSSADLFLTSATHYLTFAPWLQMQSYWLVANTGLSLGPYNPLGLFSEMLPPCSYITKGTFLIYHQSQVFSKFRPEKLYTHVYPFTNTVNILDSGLLI